MALFQAPVYPAPADSHAHFLAFLQLIGVQLDGTRDLQYYQELYALVQQVRELPMLVNVETKSVREELSKAEHILRDMPTNIIESIRIIFSFQLPFLHALPDANSPREHQDAAISAWVEQYLTYQGLDTSVFQLYYNPNQTSMVGFHQVQRIFNVHIFALILIIILKNYTPKMILDLNF